MSWRLVIHRRVIVNLLSGDAIEGVLLRAKGQLLFLADATLLPEQGQPTPVDGEVIVERAQIAFVQALPVGR